MDDNTDAWFIGFDPDITVGVWIGFDEKKSLGTAEQGAFAALPIWMEFMKAYIDGRPDKDDPPKFEAPGNIVFLARATRANGAVLPPDTPGVDQRSVHLRHAARRRIRSAGSRRSAITKSTQSTQRRFFLCDLFVLRGCLLTASPFQP